MSMSSVSVFREMSVSEFYAKNKQLAGFDNPIKGAYTSIRELVENSLDACELAMIQPEIGITINKEGPYYVVKVMDNGPGIPKGKLAWAVGKVLYSTKYILRQHRGELGMGGTMVLLSSVIETGKPFKVLSSMPESHTVYGYEMLINVKKNEPEILKEISFLTKKPWHGLVIKFYSHFDYERGLRQILNYLKLTTLACPYVTIVFKFDNHTVFEFKAKTQNMPKPPTVTRYHPHGVNFQLVKDMVRSTNSPTLLKFLTTHFQKVGERSAEEILDKCKLSPDLEPQKLNDDKIRLLVSALTNAKLETPTINCLSWMGEELLTIGIKEYYAPEYMSYSQRRGVYLGHPFIVEAAVGFGGKVPTPRREFDFELLRFANKIPLLYDKRSCGFTRVVEAIPFKNNYDIDPFDPVVIVLHLCSTHIPYKTVGKEFIAPDVEEITKVVSNCLKDALRKIKTKIRHHKRLAFERKRWRVINAYLKVASSELGQVINTPPEDIYSNFAKWFKFGVDRSG